MTVPTCSPEATDGLGYVPDAERIPALENLQATYSEPRKRNPLLERDPVTELRLCRMWAIDAQMRGTEDEDRLEELQGELMAEIRLLKREAVRKRKRLVGQRARTEARISELNEWLRFARLGRRHALNDNAYRLRERSFCCARARSSRPRISQRRRCGSRSSSDDPGGDGSEPPPRPPRGSCRGSRTTLSPGGED